MIISTMNDLPGYAVKEVLGEVFGLTVRSRHVGSQLGAGLKSLVGGELRGMTKALQESRQEAQQRLHDEAAARGAGTQGEITYAHRAGIPVYLVLGMPQEKISGWVLGCASEVFADFDQLRKAFNAEAAEVRKESTEFRVAVAKS